jgi:hypothetical protein
MFKEDSPINTKSVSMVQQMSEIPAGLTFMEKLFGIILVVLGALFIYLPTVTVSIDIVSASIVTLLGIVFIGLGIFAIIIKQ